MHLKQMFLYTLLEGSVTRAQLAAHMGLSAPSVSALTDKLLAVGLFTQTGLGEPPLGRPPALLRVNPHRLAIPVVKILRQGIHWTLYDLCLHLVDSGVILYEKPLPGMINEAHQYQNVDSETLYRTIATLAEKLMERYSIPALILSLPGNLNREKGLFTSSVLKLMTSSDFVNQLENSGLTVVTGNSSDYFAFAEKFYQTTSGDYIFLNIGEGVGGGIIRGGEIFASGERFRSGEIGHISIDYQGRPCSCGNRGCLERYINQNALVEAVQKQWQKNGEAEHDCNFDTLVVAFKQEDSVVSQVLMTAAHQLVAGISNMLAILDTTHVILGGGIERLGPAFLDMVRQCAVLTGYRNVMDGLTITYTRNTADDESSGAAWYYLNHLFDISALTLNN